MREQMSALGRAGGTAIRVGGGSRAAGGAGEGRGGVEGEGLRVKMRRLLPGPVVTVRVAGYRDLFGRVNTEPAGAALAAHNHRLLVLGTDDLVRDMAAVLTLFCGCESARNRVLRAVVCARQAVRPRAVKLQMSGGGV